MAQNYIQIFDDTVLKQSINQGTEEQRSNTITGSFTLGELAFTRDTGRIFVGDCGNNQENSQETIGGILSGNKYLCLIDSKKDTSFLDNGLPLNYELETISASPQPDEIIKENPLLTSTSKFRLNEFDNWNRDAIYNPKYKSYNGDIMYDLYINALIIFDTNISNLPDKQPKTVIINGKEIFINEKGSVIPLENVKRRTKLVNYTNKIGDDTETHDIYGDGYTIFRLIEPDNETVRFKPRKFNADGTQEGVPNSSHNLLEVFNIKTTTLQNNFTDDFVFNVDTDKISLNKKLKDVISITTPISSNDKLSLPKNLSLGHRNLDDVEGRDSIDELNLSFKALKDSSPSNDRKFKWSLIKSNSDAREEFTVNIVEDVNSVYWIKLGEGLTNSNPISSNTSNKLILLDGNSSTSESLLNTIEIDNDINIDSLDLYSDPFNVNFNSSKPIYYISNIGILKNGLITTVDIYSEEYKEQAKEFINKFENENVSINYLKEPVIITWVNFDNFIIKDNLLCTNTQLEFTIEPYFYCQRKYIDDPSATQFSKVKIIDDIYAPAITHPNEYFSLFGIYPNMVKAWENGIMVIGNNTYKNYYTNDSDAPLIDDLHGFKYDDVITGTVNQPIFKSIIDIDPSEYSSKPVTPLFRNDIISWRIYTDADGNKSYKLESENNQLISIDFVNINNKTDNLIDSTINGVYTETLPEYVKKYIPTYSVLLIDSTPVKFSYGIMTQIGDNLPFKKEINMVNNYTINYFNNIKLEIGERMIEGVLKSVYLIEDDILESIELCKMPGKQITSLSYTKGDIGGADDKIAQFNNIIKANNGILQNFRTITTLTRNLDVSDIKYDLTFIDKDIKFVKGIHEPMIINDYNEIPDIKTVIPNHAKSVILEITNLVDSSIKSEFGVFVSNEIENLGQVFTGLGSAEVGKDNIKKNDGYFASKKPIVNDTSYVLTDGVYKMTPPYIASSEKNEGLYKFNDFTKDSTYNSNVKQPLFFPSPKEKQVLLTDSTITQQITVPLTIGRFTGKKQFALRIPNIHYGNDASKHTYMIRLLGYTL